MRSLIVLSLLPALNAYRFDGLFQTLAAANVAVTLAAVAWVLILKRLAPRHAWAQAWARLRVLSLAGFCTVSTWLMWLLQDAHHWNFSWLTFDDLVVAICAVVGLLAGACIPAVLRVCRLTP